MRVCSVPGCGEKHAAKSFCQKHYNDYRSRLQGRKPRVLKFCTAPGCTNTHKAKGLCVNHYNLMLYHRKKGRSERHL